MIEIVFLSATLYFAIMTFTEIKHMFKTLGRETKVIMDKILEKYDLN